MNFTNKINYDFTGASRDVVYTYHPHSMNIINCMLINTDSKKKQDIKAPLISIIKSIPEKKQDSKALKKRHHLLFHISNWFSPNNIFFIFLTVFLSLSLYLLFCVNNALSLLIFNKTCLFVIIIIIFFLWKKTVTTDERNEIDRNKHFLDRTQSPELENHTWKWMEGKCLYCLFCCETFFFLLFSYKVDHHEIMVCYVLVELCRVIHCSLNNFFVQWMLDAYSMTEQQSHLRAKNRVKFEADNDKRFSCQRVKRASAFDLSGTINL